MSRGKVIEDPSLSGKVAAKAAELADARIEGMTVADRLTRQAVRQQTIIVDLSDPEDEEPLEVELQIPVMAEVDYLSTMQIRLEETKTVAEYEAIMQTTAEILGRLCVDESLDAEFWKAGHFKTETLFGLVKAVTEEAVERLQASKNFRKQSGRPGAPAAVRVPRKVSP